MSEIEQDQPASESPEKLAEPDASAEIESSGTKPSATKQTSVARSAGIVSIYATALLADVEKIDEWRPDGLPSTSPLVSLPRHRVERAAAVGALSDGETLVLVVPVPGTDGARVVVVRVWLPRPT